MSQLPPMQSGPPASNPYASPQFGGGGGPPPQIKNYLVESILSLVCCGGIFAIPAIIYASQVNGKLAAGDYQGAQQASANAKKWLIIAVSLGVVCTALGMGIQIIAAISQSQNGGQF
ncbi:MAG: CD225/dispanin family protein [Pirellulales bacterium]